MTQERKRNPGFGMTRTGARELVGYFSDEGYQVLRITVLMVLQHLMTLTSDFFGCMWYCDAKYGS